jgi:single-strand DNA-binding protein
MINKAIIIGHVGQDPEVRYTGNATNGAKVAQIRVATTERYKDKDGKVQELTEWHSIVCWRGLADIVEKYVKKGTLVYVEGKIQSRSWEDKGVKKYATDIIANTLQLLSKKEQSGGQIASDPYIAGARQMQAQQQVSAPAVTVEDNPEDDLPF